MHLFVAQTQLLLAFQGSSQTLFRKVGRGCHCCDMPAARLALLGPAFAAHIDAAKWTAQGPPKLAQLLRPGRPPNTKPARDAHGQTQLEVDAGVRTEAPRGAPK